MESRGATEEIRIYRSEAWVYIFFDGPGSTAEHERWHVEGVHKEKRTAKQWPTGMDQWKIEISKGGYVGEAMTRRALARRDFRTAQKKIRDRGGPLPGAECDTIALEIFNKHFTCNEAREAIIDAGSYHSRGPAGTYLWTGTVEVKRHMPWRGY